MNFKDISEITLQYSHTSITYNIALGFIRYRNTLNPSSFGGNIVDDSFYDEKNIELDSNQQRKCNKTIKHNITKLPFESDLMTIMLPPGASHEAYLRCETKNNNTLFYTNVRNSKSGFTIEHELIRKEFLEIYNLLSSLCEFPQIKQKPITVDFPTDSIEYPDERYYNQTLWMCPHCKAGNLLEHTICFKCKKNRGW